MHHSALIYKCLHMFKNNIFYFLIYFCIKINLFLPKTNKLLLILFVSVSCLPLECVILTFSLPFFQTKKKHIQSALQIFVTTRKTANPTGQINKYELSQLGNLFFGVLRVLELVFDLNCQDSVRSA